MLYQKKEHIVKGTIDRSDAQLMNDVAVEVKLVDGEMMVLDTLSLFNVHALASAKLLGGDFGCAILVSVPRIQFLAIEIARNREGHNKKSS